MKNIGLLRNSKKGSFFILQIENPCSDFHELLLNFLSEENLRDKLLQNFSAYKDETIFKLGYESRATDKKDYLHILSKMKEFFLTNLHTKLQENFLETIKTDGPSGHVAP